MERRFDHRYLTGIGLAGVPVRITDLAKPQRCGEGRMTDISKSGMGVAAPFPLAEGDIVQIDVEDSRLFGFVVHSRVEASEYRAGVELQRVLIGGSDLSQVLSRALQTALPELPGVLTGGFSA